MPAGGAQAFEAAGFLNAFRVELLPDGADPMDVRYNVIQWVHRATRGWSYGDAVTDPRTGEIIKGHVTLGSLRVRQDYLIAEGLLAPYETGRPASPAMEKMALARLRQLAAHEVGHTLGLAHNYIASTAGRASVMDYPPPLVTLRPDGTIDLSEAYATGIGEWDKVAIAYGYSEFTPGQDEPAALTRILDAARARGLIFLTDQDARPLGSSHPQAHLWDTGVNAVDELQRLLAVRSAALARFGENVIKPGRPLATLEDALVPVYLMHRYQVEAAAKSIAGTALHLRAARRRPGAADAGRLRPSSGARSRRCWRRCHPRPCRCPSRCCGSFRRGPPDFERHRELFANHTGGHLRRARAGRGRGGPHVRALFEPARRGAAGRAEPPAIRGSPASTR